VAIALLCFNTKSPAEEKRKNAAKGKRKRSEQNDTSPMERKTFLKIDHVLSLSLQSPHTTAVGIDEQREQ
jgi:hypothetical protein